MRYGGFIREDIVYINERAAWTVDQAAVFKLLVAGNLTDGGIMAELKMSHARYYGTKKEIRKKIDRILTEKREKHGILVPLIRGKIS